MVELVNFDFKLYSHPNFVFVVIPQLEVLPLDFLLVDLCYTFGIVKCLKFALCSPKFLNHFSIFNIKLLLVLIELSLHLIYCILFILNHFLCHRFEVSNTAILEQSLVYFPHPRHKDVLVLPYLCKYSVQSVVVALG